MDKIERYLAQVSRSIEGPEELRSHLREELRSHLEALIEESVRAGLSPEEATAQAIETFGEPDSVREGLEAVHGRRHLAFLIDKAMDWRERTMKTTWKWSSTATMFAALTIAIQSALICFVLVFISPKMFDLASKPGVTVLDGDVASGFVRFITYFGKYYEYILLLLIAAWGLFEWRVKSENKAIMRLTGGLALTTVLSLLTAYICGVVMILMGLSAMQLIHP